MMALGSLLLLLRVADAESRQDLPKRCPTCLHARKQQTHDDDTSLKGDCLVYVVGNHGDFAFERAVQEQNPACEVHTFAGAPTQHLSGIHLHVLNHEKKQTGQSVAGFVDRLGHTNRTIRMLKVGCADCTWDSYTSWFLFSLLGAGMDVRQISIELPWHSGEFEERALSKFMHTHRYLIPRIERAAPSCDVGCLGHIAIMAAAPQQEDNSRESQAALISPFKSAKPGFFLDAVDTSLMFDGSSHKSHEPPIPAASQKAGVLPVPRTLLGAELPAATPRSLAERWYSPECMQWFAKDKTEPARGGTWDTFPQRVTREDLCKGGRRDSVEPAHSANEVVIVHELKMVYVEVRKSASSTIRKALNNIYGAGYGTCGGTLVSEQCKGVHGRCTSECLSGRQLKDYFFFSFVRDPTERFYSSLKEAMVGRHMNTLTKQIAMNLLQSTLDMDCGFDQHLESQAAALSTRVAPKEEGGSSFELELDFIGRMEYLQEDMEEALRQAEAKAGLPFDDVRRQQFVDDMGRKANEGSALKDVALSVRDEELDALAREVYAQDVACFA